MQGEVCRSLRLACGGCACRPGKGDDLSGVAGRARCRDGWGLGLGELGRDTRESGEGLVDWNSGATEDRGHRLEERGY